MSTENMNTPTEKQIQEVLAGTSTPEVARIVAAWFATDEGAAYLAKSMDRDAVQIKQGFEELYVNHEIPSEEMFARICRNIRQKRIRRITCRVAAVLIPFVLLIGLFVQVNTRVYPVSYTHLDVYKRQVYEIDIIPFGEVAKEDKCIYWPPEEEFKMSVQGFDEALKDFMIVRVDGEFDIRVVSLPGLFLLKLNAWIERNLETSKDGEDLWYIIENYFDACQEHYIEINYHQEVYDMDDFDLSVACLLYTSRCV